jgi:dihydrofolate reductase
VRLIVTAFLSLDGVMQAPGAPDEDRSGGFDQGGWLVPYADDDMGRLVGDSISAADAFLLGRRTYELFAAYWPQVTDEDDAVASRLNSLPKYVVSTTLDRLSWTNSTLVTRDVPAEVARLKREPGQELQAHGSGELVRTLAARGLVDEYRLWLYPVVLGAGKRLFADGSAPAALQLVDTKTTASGVAVHTYRPVGTPSYGSFALD